MRTKPIFFDPTGRRASWISWSVRISTAAVAVVCVVFVILLMGNDAPLGTDLAGSAEALFRPPATTVVTPHSLAKSAERVGAALRGQ
jgi:hypothetical protein